MIHNTETSKMIIPLAVLDIVLACTMIYGLYLVFLSHLKKERDKVDITDNTSFVLVFIGFMYVFLVFSKVFDDYVVYILNDYFIPSRFVTMAFIRSCVWELVLILGLLRFKGNHFVFMGFFRRITKI